MNSNYSLESLIKMLFISSIFIFLEFPFFSVSFLFGFSLVLIAILRRQWLLNVSGLMWFLVYFASVLVVSLVFSPLPINLLHLKLIFQLIYWLFLSLIIYNYYPRFPKKIISKVIFIAVTILLLLYVFGFKVGSQNSIAFTAIIFSPLGYYYLNKFIYKLIYAVLIIYLLLLNDSRSGAIISIIQALLVLFSSISILRRYTKLLLICSIVFSTVAFSDELMMSVGAIVAPYNDELGDLLTNTNYVLNNDLSWLQRKAQVQKAKQIFEESPIIGIGFSNFPNYKIRIDELAVGGDIALKGIEKRSAHNSYYEVLAETGLLGIIGFAGLLLLCVYFIWRQLNELNGEFEVYVFVSLIGMLIYFYSISSYLGTSSWIMYGIYAAAVKNIRGRIAIE